MVPWPRREFCGGLNYSNKIACIEYINLLQYVELSEPFSFMKFSKYLSEEEWMKPYCSKEMNKWVVEWMEIDDLAVVPLLKLFGSLEKELRSVDNDFFQTIPWLAEATANLNCAFKICFFSKTKKTVQIVSENFFSNRKLLYFSQQFPIPINQIIFYFRSRMSRIFQIWRSSFFDWQK